MKCLKLFFSWLKLILTYEKTQGLENFLMLNKIMLIPRCQLHLESDSDSLESEQFFVMTCGRFYRDTGSFQKLAIKG